MEASVHPSAFVESGAVLEDGVRVWHFAHVRAGAHLEAGVSVGKDAYIDAGVRIGRGTRIQNGVSVYNGVLVEPFCFIGPSVVFTNDLSPRIGNKTWNVVETRLRTGCSLGAGTIVRCGIDVGEFAMVGAGAVLTKSVPPFHLAKGLPAEAVSKVCACGQSHWPLGIPLPDLVRDCCRENMSAETFEIAKTTLSRLQGRASTAA